MKKLSVFCMCFLLFFGLCSTAGAVAILDPDVGGSYDFVWTDGLGQIDEIYVSGTYSSGTDYGDAWSITVSTDSFLSSTLVYDDFVTGDEFALYLDSTLVSWTISGYVGGYFQATMEDLFLAAGTHEITFYTTALATGYSTGRAFVEFSGTEPVPEPATMVLLGTGLIGLAMGSRKKLFKK